MASDFPWRCVLVSAILGLSAASLGRAQDSAGIELFERKIRPVLAEHCYRCHSAEAAKAGKLKGGLQLDTRAGIRAGGETGPAAVPGDVAKSLLVAAMRHQKWQMPPSGKLPDAVIADFVRWIESGAIDPRDGTAVAAGKIDIEKGRSFWAFQPPRTHPLPDVQRRDWPIKELDRFVLSAQEKRGLKGVEPASKREWIRRATFDLIGLPPTPEDIDAFVNDTSPEAYARVVDRLLASPHYGERWGRYWLDMARYSDDYGGTLVPVAAPNSFRYRDWIIRAFQRDLPYDQFLRLQLAGDLVSEPTDDYVERLGGLGFQGLGQIFSGNAVGMVKLKIADELDDRIDTVSRSLLALTVSCARCHDHKFDPIPTADYYSMTAAYNGATWKAERPLASPEAVAAHEQWVKTLAERKKQVDQILLTENSRIGGMEVRRIERYLIAGWKRHVLALRKQPIDAVAEAEGLHPLFLSRWTALAGSEKPLPLLTDWQASASKAAKSVKSGDVETPSDLAEQSAVIAKQVAQAVDDWERINRDGGKLKSLSPANQNLLKVFLLNDGAYFKLTSKEVASLIEGETKKRFDALQAEVDTLTKSAPPEPLKAPSVFGGGQPMQINIRGNPENLGDAVPPGMLRVLRPADAKPGERFNRLDLADAIAARENPLTARVWVNRVWHYHFGRGIVGSLSNFGQLGDRRTHPELLDHLAVRFMENGWSTRWLHREIMLSATYRLGSTATAENLANDADNQYLWRFAPRRLDFEAWRDGMLAVAGTLDPTIGGPSKGKGELQPEDPTNRRRTVYSHISRFKPNPTLTLFDFPEPNVTSERRTSTTVPQQQLFALNGPFIIEMAKAFAKRLEGERPDENARLRRAWTLAFGRAPTAREIDLSQAFLRQPPAPMATLTPWQQLCHSLLASNEFAFVN